MRKYYILVFGIFLFCQNITLNAQDTSKILRHELGFNATNFVKQILNFSSTTIPFSPYTITYKYLGNNFNVRFGAGVTTSKETEKIQNSTNDRTTKNYAMNYRFGIEKQSIITKHWKCYYGIDLMYDYVDNTSNFSSSSIRSRYDGNGAGLVYGLQYYFNKRISLFLETGFNVMKYKSKTMITNSSNPNNNQTETRSGTSGSVFLPSTLFLSIKL